MYERITEIINHWDPVGLMDFSPSDEYGSEIKEIETLISHTTDSNALANGIRNIFINSFGSDIFCKNLSECLHIANLLLKSHEELQTNKNDCP